jgi:hypothetical protein
MELGLAGQVVVGPGGSLAAGGAIAVGSPARRRTLLLLTLVLLPLSSCCSVSYQTRLPAGGPIKEDHANFYAWGLSGSKDVDLDALCPGGVHGFRSHAGGVDILLGAITLGIYVPLTIEVECAKETP